MKANQAFQFINPVSGFLLGATAAIFLAGFAQAANRTWNNTSTDFNAGGSWSGSNAPGSDDVAVFNVSATTSPNLSSSGTIQGLSFTSSGIGYSLTGTSVSLTLLSTGTTTASAISSVATSGTNTVSAPLILGAVSGTQTFSQSSGGTFVINGVITSTNSVNLSLAGGGTWILNGTNTYTGTTTQSSTGIIVVGNKAAFGTTLLSLQGGGRIQAGANLTGADKITNNIVMGANATILDSPGFGIEFGGTVDLGGAARTITSGNSAGTTFSGVIGSDGGGGLIISTSNGSLVTLSGTNTYDGITTIQGTGTVSVSFIGNSGANGNLGKGTTIRLGSGASAGNLVYTGTGETTSKTFNLGGNGGDAVIDQSGSGTLTFTSGTAGSGSRTLTLQGSTAGVGEISGRIMNGTGTTSVVKAGTGTWILSGSNSYTGATTVNAGTLVAGAANSFGSTNGITVNSGGTLLINASGAVNNAAGVTLNSGTLAVGNGVIEGSLTQTSATAGLGTLTLTANSSLDFGTGGLGGTIVFNGFAGGGHILTVFNWTSGLDHLVFNGSQNLDDFYFEGFGGGAGNLTLRQIGTSDFYEIAAVPEPATIISGFLLLGLMLYRENNRLKDLLRRNETELRKSLQVDKGGLASIVRHPLINDKSTTMKKQQILQ